eukprot:6327655-Karenia_brevis.AAC.1
MEDCAGIQRLSVRERELVEQLRASQAKQKNQPKRKWGGPIVEKMRAGDVSNIGEGQLPRNFAADGGPIKALKALRLGEMSILQRLEWLEQARLDAIFGSQRLSLASVKSGLRCYISFS